MRKLSDFFRRIMFMRLVLLSFIMQASLFFQFITPSLLATDINYKTSTIALNAEEEAFCSTRFEREYQVVSSLAFLDWCSNNFVIRFSLFFSVIFFFFLLLFAYLTWKLIIP